MKETIRIDLGVCYDGTVVSGGRRTLVVDHAALGGWIAERRLEIGEVGEGVVELEIEHNGLTDSDCHECGGGALNLRVFLCRTTTDEERASYDEGERLDAERRAAAKKKRDLSTYRRMRREGVHDA